MLSLCWCEFFFAALAIRNSFSFSSPSVCVHVLLKKYCPSLCETSGRPPCLLISADVISVSNVLELAVCVKETHTTSSSFSRIKWSSVFGNLIITTIVCGKTFAETRNRCVNRALF